MDNQRIYDAMLIKAFRKDVRMTDLKRWLKPYFDLDQSKLMRLPNSVYWPMRVQSMVGKHLKPLADRLWDTDASKDIETLDWMKNLKCQSTGTRISGELQRLKNDSNNARRKTKILAGSIALTKRNNQWNTVK